MNSVLVLMSTYNGEANLIEQLDSIRKQDDVLISLLVRDDGSVDNTKSIINDYKRSYSDFDVELICGENVGFARSFTSLVSHAHEIAQKGLIFDYYAFADQDDVWLSSKLSRAVSR